MSVKSQIERLQTNITRAFQAVEEMGVTVPSTATSDDLAGLIDQISTGGGSSVVIFGTDIIGTAERFQGETGYFEDTPVSGSGGSAWPDNIIFTYDKDRVNSVSAFRRADENAGEVEGLDYDTILKEVFDNAISSGWGGCNLIAFTMDIRIVYPLDEEDNLDFSWDLDATPPVFVAFDPYNPLENREIYLVNMMFYPPGLTQSQDSSFYEFASTGGIKIEVTT